MEHLRLENPNSPSGPTQKTVKRLFAVSGNRCAFPNCRTEIVKGGTILGEVCHIKSASPAGPRYDTQQSPEDRHGYANLILLSTPEERCIDFPEQKYISEAGKKGR
jgi:hypothetical protein